MWPDQFFNTKVLKETVAQAKWQALSADDRRAISFKFFQIAIGPELRYRIKRLPEQVRPNGKRLRRSVMDMGFGAFAFATPANKSDIVLIDFYVDMKLLRAEQRSPAWHH